MSKLDLRNQWVIVTGASSGLGWNMALELAEVHGAHIIAIARRASRLEDLKVQIQALGRSCEIWSLDLGQSFEPEEIHSRMAPFHVRAVVLNAGISLYGRMADQSAQEIDQLLQLNINSLTRWAHFFAQDFRQRKNQGAILLVSSVASYAAMPYQAVYAASKAYVSRLGRAMNYELSKEGVSVGVFEPGGIRTELLEKSGLDRQFESSSAALMDPRRCARYAARTLVRRQAFGVPGWSNAFLALVLKLLPSRWTLPIIAMIYGGAVDGKEKKGALA